MKVRENWFPFLKSLLLVVGGNILYALAVKLFLLPADLMTGGTTGIALVVNHLTGVSISMFVLVFNVCMLAAGFFMLGKQFALTTVVSTFTYPAALEFFDRMLGDKRIVYYNDISLALIDIMLVFRICEKADASGLSVLNLRESGNLCFRIPVYSALQDFRYLFCLEFHRIIEDLPSNNSFKRANVRIFISNYEKLSSFLYTFAA